MTCRPILFSGPMVRALLADTKTQTRRIVKKQPSHDWLPEVGVYHPTMVDRHGEEFPGDAVFGAADEVDGRPCPYGQPGDRLWVRERARLIEASDGRLAGNVNDGPSARKVRVRYEADGAESGWLPYPSRLEYLHTGKCIANGCYTEAARITLEITGVRVEQLNTISQADARAEGCDGAGNSMGSAFADYVTLWESINGPGSWGANPWVWVVEFKRVESNS